MDDYTPTTEDVEECYAMSGDGLDFKRAAMRRREDFRRWLAEMLAAHDAEKRAEWEAEQGEPEWEWAVESTYPYNVGHSGWTDEETAREIASWSITGGSRRLVRRRKAGPTLPVPDTTNHESEGKA